jgi:hypothetical protein
VAWELHRQGLVVASEGEGYADTYVAGFEGEKGVYDLDLQILSDGSCLNPAILD